MSAYKFDGAVALGGAVICSRSETLTTTDKFTIKKEFMLNQQLAEEELKRIIRKFKKPKLYSALVDYIWSADLEDMQLISKFNKGFQFLLCVIYIFSKYAWVSLLKDKI